MITYHITDEADYGTIKLAHITDPSRVYEAKTEAVFFLAYFKLGDRK